MISPTRTLNLDSFFFFFFAKCALLILDDLINIIDYGNMLISDADRHDVAAPKSSCHGDQSVIKSP